MPGPDTAPPTVRHKHEMPLLGIVDRTVGVAASDAQMILETSPYGC